MIYIRSGRNFCALTFYHLKKINIKMQLTITKNWTGGSGSILHTSHNVKIKEGDNYIGYGMSGENIFTLQSNIEIYQRRVVAVSPNLEWKLSGNNTLNRLPVIDLDSFL